VRRSLLPFLGLLLLQACGTIDRSVEVPLEGPPENVPPLGPKENYLKVSGRRRENSTWEWTGKTSVRVLRHPESGVRVRLFALVHVAPLSYYRSMEAQLRPSDLVLCEGLIGDSGDIATDSSLEWVARSQASTGSLLGYTSQSEWESGIKDRRWINVDCSAKAVSEGLTRETVDLVSDSGKADVLRTEQLLSGGGSPEEFERMKSKRQAALLGWVLPGDTAAGTESRTVQDPRNAAIFKWVKKRISLGREKDIALLYGALHAQALEPYFIRDLGFRLESATWHEIQTFSLGVGTSFEGIVRGYLRLLEKDYEGAESDLRRALEFDPRDAYPHCLLYATYFDRERYEEALTSIERYLAVYPDEPGPRNNRALALFYLKRYEDAAREFDALLVKAPSAVRFHDRGACRALLKDLPGAIEDFTRSLQMDPAYLLSWRDRGEAHLTRKEIPEAVSDFAKVLDLEPAHAQALSRIANLRMDQKDYDGVIRDSTRAIAKDPKQAEFYHYRGYANCLKGEYGRSIEDYEAGVSLEPESGQSWARLGQAAHYSGDLAKARTAFDKALRLDPKNHAALFHRADINYEERRWDQALEDYLKAGDLLPELGRTVQGRIWMVRSRRGDQAAATKDLLRFLADDTSPTWEWKLLAYLAGELPEAQVIRALENPDSTLEYKCLARFYVGTKRLISGDRDTAMRFLKMNRDHVYCVSGAHCPSMAELRRLEKE
jgi:tetratricopeptide (TPR) repeat protein